MPKSAAARPFVCQPPWQEIGGLLFGSAMPAGGRPGSRDSVGTRRDVTPPTSPGIVRANGRSAGLASRLLKVRQPEGVPGGRHGNLLAS
jgi:hypothetical protein